MKITVAGLGPGDFGLITLEAWEAIQNADKLYLRTAIHPTVAEIAKRGIEFETYDSFYEKASDFDALYKAIAADLMEKAVSSDIVYAVPGSPSVAEKTVTVLRELAASSDGVEVVVLEGISFIETMFNRLGLDPISGISVLDAIDFCKMPVDNPTGMIITQIYSKVVASDLKLAMMEGFPDDHEVVYAHKIGTGEERVARIPLYELDRQSDIDYLTSLYVPPLPESPQFDISELVDIVAALRSPGGCPWDIAQTHESVRQNFIEEAYEVLEAIDLKDGCLLREELGDVLMQVVFHARMAEEAGIFSMQDVVDGTVDKLVRRHPHVFGDTQASDAAAALLSWEAAKKIEKSHRKSQLDGIPMGLPSLMEAQKLQSKAAKVGFDWDDIGPVWEKLSEEIGELKEAVESNNSNWAEEEMGDLFFAAVNLARFLKIDSEVALRRCNSKFRRRFLHVEKRVKESGKEWNAFRLDDLDRFWDEAKELEKDR